MKKATSARPAQYQQERTRKRALAVVSDDDVGRSSKAARPLKLQKAAKSALLTPEGGRNNAIDGNADECPGARARTQKSRSILRTPLVLHEKR